MGILDTFLILLIHVICFIAGMKLANKYNREKECAVKLALERQYQRLNAGMDADDPCKPYVGPELTDEDLIPTEFMDRLHENGSASMKIGKTPA